MASSLIHIVVASEINKKIKRDNDEIILGSIAPDISKHIGETKVRSHFLDENSLDEVPNIDRFLERYRDEFYDDFVLGYFIHLFTDFLWFKYFIPEIYSKDMITKLDGGIVKVDKDALKKYIYNDYSNLNEQLLNEYNMNLEVLYKPLPQLNDIIEEIPMEKLDIIVEQSVYIIENSKVHKDYIFNMENVRTFINTSIELTLAKLRELGIE